MIRSTLSSFVGLGVATLVAMQLGGVRGTGVMMGFLGGAGLAGLGTVAQRQAMLRCPERVFHVHVLAFLLILGVFGTLAVLLKTPTALARHVDFGTFALSFAAAVAVILPAGAMDVARLGRRSSRASR